MDRPIYIHTTYLYIDSNNDPTVDDIKSNKAYGFTNKTCCFVFILWMKKVLSLVSSLINEFDPPSKT